MMIWHSLVQPNHKGATTESNFRDIEIIRGLPQHVDNPGWDGTEDTLAFLPNPERVAAISAMVTGNISLVLHKVEVYIGLYPNTKFLFDDLVSEGLLGLTEAVHKLAELDTPEDLGNPTGFIAQRILWAITRLVENDDKQQAPHDSRPPQRSTIEGYYSRRYGLRRLREQDDIVISDSTTLVEMRDLLDATCQTPEDAIIMEMREQGSTDLEIASRLDIPCRAVCLQRHKLMQRYDALVKATL